MRDDNDPQPPEDEGLLWRRLPTEMSPQEYFGLPEIGFHGEPGTVESQIRDTVRYIVTGLAARVARELQEPMAGRWPQMRQGMLRDIQDHLRELTVPFIPLELRSVPMSECGFSAEILGYGDLRTVELQLSNISGDMRLLAVGLDQLKREDADTLAAWLRTTANDLDPWG